MKIHAFTVYVQSEIEDADDVRRRILRVLAGQFPDVDAVHEHSFRLETKEGR